MKNITSSTITIFVLSLFVFTACGPTDFPVSPTAAPTETSPPAPTSPPTPTFFPTNTPTQPGPPTQTPPTVITKALNSTSTVQAGDPESLIAELQITLTASAAEIVSLQSQNSALKTQIALKSNTGSSNSGKTIDHGYEIPSGVIGVTVVTKAYLRDKIGENKNGAPIMRIKEPRVVLPSGTYTWVYAKKIQSDGGTIYHEIYDPDGKVTRVLYLRAVDFQVRMVGGEPFPDEFPDDVVLVEFPAKAFARKIYDYNDKGTPVMVIFEPRVQFDSGDRTWVSAVEIVSDGGTIYYEIFDPDGQVSVRLFVRKQDVVIPNQIK